MSALRQLPLLVAAAVAGPQLDQRAVGGAGPGHVQAQPGLDTGDGAVGVDGPLLVRAAVARPDVQLSTRGGTEVGHVQAFACPDRVDLAAGARSWYAGLA